MLDCGGLLCPISCMKHPRLIIEEKKGELTISFAGPSLEGLGDVDVSSWDADKVIAQVRELKSPTGEIHIEFPHAEGVCIVKTAPLRLVAA